MGRYLDNVDVGAMILERIGIWARVFVARDKTITRAC